MTENLCFAHANGFPAASYRKLLTALGEGYQVHAPEKVGHDPRFPVDANWSGLARELISYIETGIGTPVIGVGHSLGGVLTLLCALERPDLFRAIVLMDPPAYLGLSARIMRMAKLRGFIDQITPAGKSRNRRRVWASREQALASLKDKPLFRAFDPDCLRDYVTFGMVEAGDGVRLLYEPEVEVAIFRNIPHDLDQRQAPAAVPGAILCGDSSDVIRRSSVRKLARRHGLRLEYLPGGHMFPLEHPLETAEHLKALIPTLLSVRSP